MNIVETAYTALKAIGANKVRSALTMLGVVIGVFAVVSLVSLGKGLENYITDEFEKMGANLIYVSPGSGDFTGDPAETYTKNPLNEEHVELIEKYADEFITGVFPLNYQGENVEYKTNRYYSEVWGINYEAVEIFNYEIEDGRIFSKAEERSNSKIVILGPNTAKELFGTRSPLGEYVSVSDEKFEVIGTFKSKGSNYDDAILIPHTTMDAVFGIDNYAAIVVQAVSADRIDATERHIELALLRDLDDEEFEVLDSAELLSSVEDILGLITVALGAIAGISLLVGGIGIMNIMLVSVTERTREIGLRKALGASPDNIATQFIIESIVLSVAGGLIGLVLGSLLTMGVQEFIRAEITLGAVIMSFIFSVLVGVIFGTYPAVNASKKDPIESLRYE